MIHIVTQRLWSFEQLGHGSLDTASRGQAACRSSGWRATDQACMTTDALEGAGEARLTEFELGDAKLSCGVKNALERR